MALKLYDTMKPQGDFPLVEAEDIVMPDGTRLSDHQCEEVITALDEIINAQEYFLRIVGVTGDCTWSLVGTTLTISGNGTMEDLESLFSQPWGHSTIKTVDVEEGVTHIGAEAFRYTLVETIYIPKSVTSIGEMAFYECDNLTTVNYKGSVEDKSKITILDGNYDLLNATWVYNYAG